MRCKRSLERFVFWVWIALALAPGCDGSSSSEPDAGDASSDADTDTDADSDSGTDTDTDSDSDTDTEPTGCWWEQMESGTAEVIGSVWGVSGSEVYATYSDPEAGEGTVLRFDGSIWEPAWVFPGYYAYSIWGFSSDDILLSLRSTDLSVGYLMRFDGSDWSEHCETVGVTATFWGGSDENLYTPADSTFLRYDGIEWAVVWEWEYYCTEENDCVYLYAVWGSAPDDVFAVGVHGWPYPYPSQNYILHYDGVEFTEMPVVGANSASLVDVYGVSATEVYAVGNDTEFEGVGEDMSTVLEYDGEVWTPIGEFDEKALAGVWASADGEVFAAGRDVVLHYKDGVWDEMSLPVYTWLRGIWGADVDNLYAVGFYGVILKYTCSE